MHFCFNLFILIKKIGLYTENSTFWSWRICNLIKACSKLAQPYFFLKKEKNKQKEKPQNQNSKTKKNSKCLVVTFVLPYLTALKRILALHMFVFHFSLIWLVFYTRAWVELVSKYIFFHDNYIFYTQYLWQCLFCRLNWQAKTWGSLSHCLYVHLSIQLSIYLSHYVPTCLASVTCISWNIVVLKALQCW